MFKKYEKTYRILIPQIPLKGNYLNPKEIDKLLNNVVYVEEKIDGANAGIIRHKGGFSLQKRGGIVHVSEHEQFQYFQHWAWQIKYENIINIPEGITIFGELMICKHCIFYDKLPDFFIVFDVWDRNKNKYYNYEEKSKFCERYGFYQVPLITRGKFSIDELYDLIPEKSKFGDTCEGIVIKHYRNKGKPYKGKIVNEKFVKAITDNKQHWTKNHLVKNTIGYVE